MLNKLTFKVQFHIAVWSQSKCKSEQNQSLSSEICSGSSHEIGRSLPVVFQLNWLRKFPQNSREIGRFFHEFVPKNPAKSDFFSATYQKPWNNVWPKVLLQYNLKDTS